MPLFPLALLSNVWLPPNFARHGASIDHLLIGFLLITGAVAVAVHVALVWVLIRYRRSRVTTAAAVRGNSRVEIIWTAVPLAILIGMAAASTRVWNAFRYAPAADDPHRFRVLVIGQQFKWNIIYPGPDNRFGRYLIYPKITDRTWPPGPGRKPLRFAGVAGPASLPPAQAAAAIARYIDQVNPLGKDFTDPAGDDDDYQHALDRPMVLPVGRPAEIDVMSKDVIHDLYLPYFRAQIYAVPGMVGKMVIEPTQVGGPWEFACAQLCGSGHETMRGTMIVAGAELPSGRGGGMGMTKPEIRNPNQ